MKALSIKQPWTSLIIEGHKEYEFRTYKTNYRGKILIHASKTIEKHNIKRFESLNLNYELGAIIGEAYITDCILVDDAFEQKLIKQNPLVYQNNNDKRIYAWKLENIKKYDKPIYVKGMLGLWNYNDDLDI